MRNAFRLSIVLAAMSVASAATWAQELPPQAETEQIEEDLGYGYTAREGAVALSIDTSAVLCPVPGVLVVDKSDEAEVLRLFGGKDLGDGRWEVTDPDTRATVVASVQYAAYGYQENADTVGVAAADVETRLPTVSRADVTVVAHPWACQRILRGYQCGTPGNCGPGGCLQGNRITQVRRFLTCKFTGSRHDRCLQFLAPVCRVTRYTCRDCTGPILSVGPLNRWVCAVF